MSYWHSQDRDQQEDKVSSYIQTETEVTVSETGKLTHGSSKGTLNRLFNKGDSEKGANCY